MTSHENYFLNIVNFLKTYESLIDCHLIDFFTEDLWNKCMPENLKSYIEEKGESAITEIEQFSELCSCQDSKLCIFLKDVTSLKLENCHAVTSRFEFLNILNYEKTKISKPIESDFMKVKKWHEVDIFTKAIVWLNKNKPSIIIDAGAGKGYSSLLLSNQYNLPTLAIECSQINHDGAILHRNVVNKKNKQSSSLIHYVVEKIDETTNYVEMVKDHFPDFYVEKELFLTALHACGSLTDSVIKSFLNVNNIKSLCIVPCCYHLASKSLSGVYEFSKNLRMLAQQSIDRIRQKNKPLSKTLFYRAIFQVIIQDTGNKDIKVGRKAPIDNFLVYARWALKKIGATKVPSDQLLLQIFEDYEKFEWKFHIFQLLRIHLAPVVEAAIILDKILFMQKSKLCEKLQVIQLFDPILSPRSWAIIAKK